VRPYSDYVPILTTRWYNSPFIRIRFQGSNIKMAGRACPGLDPGDAGLHHCLVAAPRDGGCPPFYFSKRKLASGWKPDRNDRSLAFCGLDIDLSAQRLHDRQAYRKTEACTVSRFFSREERVEDLVQVFL